MTVMGSGLKTCATSRSPRVDRINQDLDHSRGTTARRSVGRPTRSLRNAYSDSPQLRALSCYIRHACLHLAIPYLDTFQFHVAELMQLARPTLGWFWTTSTCQGRGYPGRSHGLQCADERDRPPSAPPPKRGSKFGVCVQRCTSVCRSEPENAAHDSTSPANRTRSIHLECELRQKTPSGYAASEPPRLGGVGSPGTRCRVVRA